jgi:hypothetical protein
MLTGRLKAGDKTPCCSTASIKEVPLIPSMALQVYKAFLARSNKFVAVKRINCFERVSHFPQQATLFPLPQLSGTHACTLPVCTDPCTTMEDACDELQLQRSFKGMCGWHVFKSCARQVPHKEMPSRSTLRLWSQEKRHQMMNDIKALCDVQEPSLVQFIGAFHCPESGQVRWPAQQRCPARPFPGPAVHVPERNITASQPAYKIICCPICQAAEAL